MTASGSGGAPQGSMGQGVMVLLVLLLCAGGAGFTIGYMQKFHPVDMVPPGTEGAAQTSAPAATTPDASAPATLKKAYWISTKGWDRAGYAIKVFINENDAGTFQTPDRLVEVTKFIKPGDNKIRFVAKALPEGNRTDYSGASLQLAVYQGEKYSSKGYKNGEKLVEYERKVTDTDDYDDTQDFSVVE